MSRECVFAQTKQGTVRGFCRNGNLVFYGIPYGAECDGTARFREPKPAPSWEGIRDCTQFADISIQAGMKNSPPNHVPKGMQELEKIFTGGIAFDKYALHYGENCLNLNVVTPGADEMKRPVVFYIHGGGFTGGNGAVCSAICDKLCQEENVVVVSIDHRLGALGYLYLGCFDESYRTSGLVGMLDIILALEWTRDNIAAFGGDGQNITVYGESGGGMKIATLMAMPKAKGLFHKAYINSGACKVGIVSQEEGTKFTMEFLKSAGIAPEDWKKVFALSAEEIAEAQEKVSSNPDVTAFYPVADGVHLQWNEDNAYKTFEMANDISVIVGASEDELALMHPIPILTRGAAKKKLIQNENIGGFGMAKYYYPGLTKENVDEVMDVFARKDGIKRTPTHLYAFIISSFHFLGGGAYHFAMQKCKQSAPVYLYKVSFDTPLFGNLLKSAWHTADLSLSFRAVYLPEHERISKGMGRALGAFARAGSPDTSELAWKPFDEENKYTMVFGYDENVCMKDPDRDIHELVERCGGEHLKGL